MRGCLFTLLLGAAVLTGLTVFALPRLAESAIGVSLTAGGLKADHTDVTVVTDPPTELLALHADRVTIRATGAHLGVLEAARVDLRLADVDLRARRATSVTGILESAVATTPDGPIAISTIRLDGDSSRVTAIATVDRSALERVVAERVAAQTGQEPTAVVLEAPNMLTIVVGGTTVRGAMRVDEGGAVLLAIPQPFATDVTLLDASATPLRLSAVRVTGEGVVLEGSLDPRTLFG